MVKLNSSHPPIAYLDKRLLSQICAITPICHRSLDQLAREILAHDIPWSLNYTEYQSLGWYTTSLVNTDGRSQNTTIGESNDSKSESLRETDLLRQLPAAQKLLKMLDLNVFWVRLARLDPGAYLWEHVDYTEFDDKPRLRLHIPVITSQGARLIVDKSSIHMMRGYLWLLNPKGPHGACNIGFESRIHLILDCYVDAKLQSLMAGGWIPEHSVHPLPPMAHSSNSRAKKAAERLARAGFNREAERLLLTQFHQFKMPAGESLKAVYRLYQEVGNRHRADLWQKRCVTFLGGVNH